MSRESHLATVSAVYAAFGAGDVAGLLAHLDPNAVWSNQGPEHLVPAYFGTKHGHEGALTVLGYLATNVDISVFNPHTFVADDERVVVLVRLEGTAKATGRSYGEDIAQLFEFGADGLITRFCDFQDSAAIVGALVG
jgi:ketosteroid isomerase-like protein